MQAASTTTTYRNPWAIAYVDSGFGKDAGLTEAAVELRAGTGVFAASTKLGAAGVSAPQGGYPSSSFVDWGKNDPQPRLFNQWQARDKCTAGIFAARRAPGGMRALAASRIPSSFSSLQCWLLLHRPQTTRLLSSLLLPARGARRLRSSPSSASPTSSCGATSRASARPAAWRSRSCGFCSQPTLVRRRGGIFLVCPPGELCAESAHQAAQDCCARLRASDCAIPSPPLPSPHQPPAGRPHTQAPPPAPPRRCPRAPSSSTGTSSWRSRPKG